jgi:hypothetical protein
MCKYFQIKNNITFFSAALRFVFAGTPDCDVIHGVLYSCLRALFGLSVIGILVCIFSCMLVYQLLRSKLKFHDNNGRHFNMCIASSSSIPEEYINNIFFFLKHTIIRTFFSKLSKQIT